MLIARNLHKLTSLKIGMKKNSSDRNYIGAIVLSCILRYLSKLKSLTIAGNEET
jgi:hypothetical protein